MTLPPDIVANTLNSKTRRVERGHIDDDTVPMLHVSSLIKSSKNDFFCEREFVLRYIERIETSGGGIPPKFALLYAVGHFYGDHIVREFLRRNIDYAKYAWGDWECKCGSTKISRSTLPVDSKCTKCETLVDNYLEVDLFNPAKTVIGHADLIFFKDGIYYVYEFKSIDRADIIFDEITEPIADHLMQASNYYYMLKGEGKKVSKRIRFVYADRSMSGLYTSKPFKEVSSLAVPVSRLRKIYLRAKKVKLSIEKGILPKRKCDDIRCTRAKGCPAAITCFNRQKKKVKRISLG